jgi:hypothetical protein
MASRGEVDLQYVYHARRFRSSLLKNGFEVLKWDRVVVTAEEYYGYGR